MQNWPLVVSKLLDHAAQNHGSQEIVTEALEGGTHRTTWGDIAHRARQLAEGLQALGIGRGDRVATLAWNTYRHVECFFGIPGAGAVAHTINPRLFAEQIVYIANHAGDRILFLDLSFVDLVEQLAPQFETITHYVVLTDRAHMPTERDIAFLCYEELLQAQSGDFAWVEVDENDPSGLCYTSGTTGDPKGVLYSHRSNVLHSMASVQIDAFQLSSRSVLMPVVPMYHANAWGLPYAAAMVGAKLVLNGDKFDAPSLHAMIIDEGVNITGAVPTVWTSMLHYLEQTEKGLGALERVIIGGSAAPRAMIEVFARRFGIEVLHAWGMTELSPVGTVGTLSAAAAALPPDQQLDLRCKQGRALFGVEMIVCDDDHESLPRNGATPGRLMVKGPWIVERYYRQEESALDGRGFFDTGDIATIDPLGYMQITDRSKDVIKSGGEWISSIQLENAVMGCDGVGEAAVVGIPHPQWGERPLLFVVRKPHAPVSGDDILRFLETRVAKWWLPDTILFVDALPHTATGKILKTELREWALAHTRGER
nr:long-chain fatty acid--CoA ligase [Caenibius tardaugens]